MSVVGKMLTAALMLSTTAHAQRGSPSARRTNRSSAKCQVVALGYSELSNKEAIATVTADASAYICSGDGDEAKAEAIAEATAEAFALAVATATAECELEGDAEVQVQSSSSTTAAAKVWLEAYAEAIASAASCDKCDAYADSYGYVEQEVFLKAVAEADVKFQAATTEGVRKFIRVVDYKKDVKKVVVTAYAEALASAANFKDGNGCLAFVNAEGCIYNPEAKNPNLCFECEAEAVSEGSIEEIDAIAEASAHASAWSCGDTVSIVDLEQTAHALAEATAEAFSFAYASCKVEEGFACAYADTEIKQVAYAVAQAYADFWVDAHNCEDTCTVSADAIASACGDILVTAATEAFVDRCSGDGSTWSVADLTFEIEKASLCALAEASVFAITGGSSGCVAGGVVYADAKESSCPAPAPAEI